MTDLTTSTPITETRISLHGIFALHRPLGLRRTTAAFGNTIVAFLAAYGKALEMAYSAPYSGPSRKQPLVSEEDLEGRDPNW